MVQGGALTGLRVLEFADFVAGPYAAKLLADMGATVVKIEPPNSGDSARRRGPFAESLPDPDKSGLFWYLNSSKKSVTLDPLCPTGRQVLFDLLRTVDVFIQDRPLAVLRKASLTYRQLAQANPRLVMVSVTPFGLRGPYRNYKAYYMNVFHSGSEGYATPGGTTDLSRPPLKVGKYAGEYLAGAATALATLIAVHHQEATGQGQEVDVSKQRVLAGVSSLEALRYPNDGAITTRATRGYLSAGVFLCKDGYIQLAVQQEREWQAFLDVLGNPPWKDEPRFKDHPSRERHAAELKALVRDITKDRTREDLYRTAIEKRCSLVPYYSIAEVVASAQLKARGYFITVQQHDGQRVTMPGVAYQCSRTPAQIGRAPRLGEHNVEMYTKLLGYSHSKLQQLRGLGVI